MCYNTCEPTAVDVFGRGPPLIKILLTVTSITLLGVQQASAFTQFHFDIDKPVNGTQYKAAQFNEGEYLDYIWTYDGKYHFTKEMSGIWENENAINVSPTNKFNIVDKLGMFAINSTLPSGEPVRLCINSPSGELSCQQTTVDTSGRAFFD